MKKLLALLSVLLIVAGCFQNDSKPASKEQQTPALKQGSIRETPVVDAVKMIDNSVVNIRTEKIIRTSIGPNGEETIHGQNYYNDFYGYNKTYKTQSLGSGVIVKDDGTIITNYHVIESASKIYVMMNDNSTYEAELVGGDNIIDIAILKIKNVNKKFPVAKTGDSDNVMLGETVIAMGNPYGLNSSITTGVISSVKRILNMGLGYAVFIQTDALINPGNSGGPLVNLDGEVIGINSAMFQQAQGIGFSIPINTALRIMPEILKTHTVKMGYLGLSAQEVKDKDGTHLKVVKVEKDSNPEKIGIQPEDRIVLINDIPVSSLMAMSNMLRSYPAGSSISIVVDRNGKTFKGKVLLTDYPQDHGLKLLKESYGLDFNVKGKFLIVKSSNVPQAVSPGDMLIAMNDTEIKSLEELNKFINDNTGRQIVMTVYRGANMLRIKMQI